MFCKHEKLLHRCRMCKLIQLYHLIPNLSKDVIRYIIKMVQPEGKLVKMYYNLNHMEDEYGEASYFSFTKCFDQNGKLLFNFTGTDEEYCGFLFGLCILYGNNKLDNYCQSTEFNDLFGISDRVFIENGHRESYDKAEQLLQTQENKNLSIVSIGDPYYTLNFCTINPNEFINGVLLSFFYDYQLFQLFRLEMGTIVTYKLNENKLQCNYIVISTRYKEINVNSYIEIYKDGNLLLPDD